MRPTLTSQRDIEAFLEEGQWSGTTQVEIYQTYAVAHSDWISCVDATESYSWFQLDGVTDRLAAGLVELGLPRDATALVQMPSTCREIVIRVAFKKAGIIGVFVPLQWRRNELNYVASRIDPRLLIFDRLSLGEPGCSWVEDFSVRSNTSCSLINLADEGVGGWINLSKLLETHPNLDSIRQLQERQFKFDEVSLITASSGTSGVAKLCEWPEGAQICMGRVLGERMEFQAGDRLGVFAPMSGAAGLVVWLVSTSMPLTCIFPQNFHAMELLAMVSKHKLTAATTVPVILARLVQEDLAAHDFGSLRFLRVGTAAADMDAARSFEGRTGCKVVIASGSMEVPGFGHVGTSEPKELRLDGSVGSPLQGCRHRIMDEVGNILPAGEIGELNVRAPFGSSGYWNDPSGNQASWTDGWYSTGDMGVLDKDGRLTLKGRLKETINRSGHKILPSEIEKELAKHPDVFECAVIAAPDKEYGQVPWAFVQLRDGCSFDEAALSNILRNAGFASYKIPTRIIQVPKFPRVVGSKVDKKALRETYCD